MKALWRLLCAIYGIFYGPDSHAARRYEIQAEVEREAEARRNASR